MGHCSLHASGLIIDSEAMYFLVNLQANTELLGMKWPLGAKGPILTFDTENAETANIMQLEYEYLR